MKTGKADGKRELVYFEMSMGMKERDIGGTHNKKNAQRWIDLGVRERERERERENWVNK